MPRIRAFLEGPWVWVLAAFLVASPRLFEQGISLDPALYAVVSRNFAGDGKWWSLRFGQTLFPQFFEQPFLVFWIQGFVFKWLGASDYTTRLVGLGLGSLGFYFLFRIGELLGGRFVASVFALLCVIDVNYVGRLATLYLEVPLTFFSLGALYYFLLWAQSRKNFAALGAGLFMGAACLTKGFAALPALGTLGLVGLYFFKWRLLFCKGVWVFAITGVIVVVTFCFLQHEFGEYSFAQLYYRNTFLERTMSVGAAVGPWPFLNKFMWYAAIPLVLSVGSVARILRHKDLRPVFLVGLMGMVTHVCAGATLGFAHLHYFHGIFPFLNLMASVGVSGLFFRYRHRNWGRGALVLGLSVQLFWHLVPFSLRKKGPPDYYQLRGVMTEIASTSPGPIQTVGISENDWVYRQFSFWYWGLDSVLKGSAEAVEAPVVLVRSGRGVPLSGRGYQACASSAQYAVWVRGKNLVDICQRNPFDVRIIK